MRFNTPSQLQRLTCEQLNVKWFGGRRTNKQEEKLAQAEMYVLPGYRFTGGLFTDTVRCYAKVQLVILLMFRGRLQPYKRRFW